MSDAFALHDSDLLLVKETQHAGRSVFAGRSIPARSLIFETSYIAAHVIHRSYRKEACSYCFTYAQGRNLALRPEGTGLAFCNVACQMAFYDAVGRHGVAAFQAVEGLLSHQKTSGDDIPMGTDPTRPSTHVIEQAWSEAEHTARQVLDARTRAEPTAKAKKKLRDVRALIATPNVMLYILSGLINLSGSDSTEDRLKALRKLESTDTPYPTHYDLNDHVTAYCQLLAVAPQELLPSIDPHPIQQVAASTAHNAFDIRSVDHDMTSQTQGVPNDEVEAPGSEVLGVGLWPEASYFNHSCSPNVRKKREGRKWRFWTTEDVAEGDELNITYMGGDEKELDVHERKERLKDGWGFDCACGRCARERTPQI